ncbi:cation diffusion facilitator family transporter [Streptomyces sp. Amel2xE9]|uniref:cation diffusion facilitator family transporter n=1 Tax=unclassified Streptomyces TaxID=2593676 RepID=UPI00035E65F3|nr:cation diffusion facilitator family transporter [Streptomyces sp. Amel2xE9]
MSGTPSEHETDHSTHRTDRQGRESTTERGTGHDPEPGTGRGTRQDPQPSTGGDTAHDPRPGSGRDSAHEPGPSSGGDSAHDPRPGTERSTAQDTGAGAGAGPAADRKTRVTVLVALLANLVIAVAKAVGGIVAHSPALLSEAAHSVADSFNEIFLLAALRRSRRPADRRHPFGYGKERFFWSLLAAVGIFVMGGCFSFFQGVEALRNGAHEDFLGYTVGLIVLGVAFLAEGVSLLRALHQVRQQGGGSGLRDPALRTVVAEDGTAVLGVTLAMIGMALHWVTGQVVWEASASLAIGALLVYVAYRLGCDARDQLIGEAADPELSGRIGALLRAQPEIDSVEALFTMKMGLDSMLVAARIDLAPGLDSERVEEVAVRIKRSIARTVPDADQIFLDVTDRPAEEARESPAATGERGGA